jgi:hypothetical protein
MANKKVRVAILGVGNCASSLVQGIHYYRNAKDTDTIPGLIIGHPRTSLRGPLNNSGTMSVWRGPKPSSMALVTNNATTSSASSCTSG